MFRVGLLRFLEGLCVMLHHLVGCLQKSPEDEMNSLTEWLVGILQEGQEGRRSNIPVGLDSMLFG